MLSVMGTLPASLPTHPNGIAKEKEPYLRKGRVARSRRGRGRKKTNASASSPKIALVLRIGLRQLRFQLDRTAAILPRLSSVLSMCLCVCVCCGIAFTGFYESNYKKKTPFPFVPNSNSTDKSSQIFRNSPVSHTSKDRKACGVLGDRQRH